MFWLFCCSVLRADESVACSVSCLPAPLICGKVIEKQHRHCCVSALGVLGSEAVVLQALNAASGLSLEVPKAHAARYCRFVGALLELLPVLMDMFQCPHETGNAIISLGFAERLTVVGCYSLLSGLYLGQPSSIQSHCYSCLYP